MKRVIQALVLCGLCFCLCGCSGTTTSHPGGFTPRSK